MQTLNESQRKWLTEYIGECWHELKMMPDRIKCSCGMVFELKEVDYAERHVFCSRQTFTTWADLGAVMEAIQKKGEWENFVMFASRVHGSQYDGGVMGAFSDLIAWLINPSRFCELVCRWKGVE